MSGSLNSSRRCGLHVRGATLLSRALWGAVVVLLVCTTSPRQAAAFNKRHRAACSTATSQGNGSVVGRSRHSCAARGPDPALLIAGGIIGGTGLVLAAVGFGTFGGIHAGNPGKGLELTGFDDRDREKEVVRLARGMQSLGIIGAVLTATGVVMVGVGIPRFRKATARRPAAPSFALAPGIGSLTLVGRF